MLFMNKWRCHPGKQNEVYKAFSEMPADDNVGDGGPNIKVIGRWHDMAGGTGVVVYECDDPEAMMRWALNWTELLELEVVPVVNDEDAKAFARSKG